MLHYERIKQVDQEIYKVFEQELNRQQTHLELDCKRKLCGRSGIRGIRFDFDQQVC